ncbi:alpha/beta hydrolase [Pseudomonas sp. Z3-8]|uniref:alpha/beta hydrolase n=1 Tax=Pseudomonas sp. Z3-8 TaxID=2817412 RepID=UPI003DA9D172
MSSRPLNTAKLWPADENELAQVRSFNRKLVWLPRFRIRNRVTPRLIQALLRASQINGDGKLNKHGLVAEKRRIGKGDVAVPVRIIRPKGKARGVVLDFHGGGWVIGNAQMNDPFNIAMVQECGVAVVSVDYRLAVSTPVEGLMEDCLSAARWLLGEKEEFADLPVIVVGESAGGHLAVATLLALKQWPDLLGRIRGAVLYYGVYDLAGTPSVHAAGAETLVLDGPGMVDALRLLTPGLSDEERRQAPLSPLYGDFTGMPAALLFTGELDPLRDDTLGLAELWGKAATVEAHLLPSCPHGFIHFPTAIAEHVLKHSRDWITARLNAASTPHQSARHTAAPSR